MSSNFRLGAKCGMIVDIYSRQYQVATHMFKERMRTRMEQIGIIPADLSRKTGIAPAQISKYLSGTRPLETNVVKIANALQTTTDYLLGRVDDPAMPVFLSAEEKELFDAFYRGDSEKIMQILAPRLAQAFASNPKLLTDK